MKHLKRFWCWLWHKSKHGYYNNKSHTWQCSCGVEWKMDK